MKLPKLAQVLVVLGIASVGFAQQTVAFRGRVVDANGAPVVKANIGATWIPDGETKTGPLKLKPYRGVTSDAEGRFSIELDIGGGKTPLMAISLDGRLGCLTLIDASTKTELQMIVRPMTTVRAKIQVESSIAPPESTNCVTWIGDLRGPILFQADTFAPIFELSLPPGAYVFRLEARNSIALRKEVRLDGNSPVLDLGLITAKPSIYSTLLGKTLPPLSYSEARGVPSGFRLEDTRGKWTILEFWGFW